MESSESRFEELTADMSHDAREDLAARLRDMQATVNACTVVTFFVSVFSTHYALAALSDKLTSSNPTAVIRVPYQPIVWWIFPVVGGFTMAWELTLQVWSLFGRREMANQYRELAKSFVSTYRGRTGAYQTQTFMKWASLVLAAPIGVFSLLALNMHTNFEAAGVRECGYAFRPCEFHTYSELTGAIHTNGFIGSRGTYVERPNVILEFRSGYQWRSSMYDLRDAAAINKIEKLVVDKTEIELKSMPLLPPIPKSQPPVQ